MNKLFFWSSKSKFRGYSGNEVVLEIPNYLDIFNRDAASAKQKVIAAFTDQIKIDKELQNKSYLFSLGYVLIRIVNFFGDFNPSDIYYQITSLNSLVVKCESQSGINFYVETFFDVDNGSPIEVVVNVFKGEEQLFNNSGNLEEMLEEIKQNFYSQDLDYVTYLNHPVDYEVSTKSFATADF